MRSRGGCATVEHLRALALVRQDGLSHSSESRTAGLSRLNESCATDPPRLRGRTSPSEVAPRPPRTHSIPRGRAPLSESGSRSQGSHSVLRARIAFFEPESRFSDSDSAPQVRVPFLRFAFRSLDSNHTPWVCSRSPDSNLASRLAFRPSNPNSAPPVRTLLCEPECHSFDSRSPSKLECRTFGSRSPSEPEFRPIRQDA